MIFKKKTIIILGLTFLFICNSLALKVNVFSNTFKATDEKQDTIIKDIPTNRLGKPWSFYEDKSFLEQILRINSLEKGVDSIEIRLWYRYNFNDTAQLIILSNRYGKWNCELIEMKYIRFPNQVQINEISQKSRSGEPKSGWRKFIPKLINLGVLTLPDYNSIPKYYTDAGGADIVVQVATRNSYRIYSYLNPGAYSREFWQARKMLSIMRLFEAEFKFKQVRNF